MVVVFLVAMVEIQKAVMLKYIHVLNAVIIWFFLQLIVVYYKV